MTFADQVGRPGVPRVATDVPLEIRAAAILTSTYVYSDIVDVSDAREVVLLLDVDYAAATSFASLIPALSAQGAPPAAGDDAWFIPGTFDGSVTAGLPGGTAPTGADFTLAPDFGQVTMRPIEIRTEPADAATDELRMAVQLDVSWARWLQVAAADQSGAGTLATLAMSVVRKT